MVELFVLDEIGLTLGPPMASEYAGTAAWRVAAKFRAGREMTMYFARATWLEIARVHRVTAPDGSTAEITFTLGDYRKVGGLLLPHDINGSPASYEIIGRGSLPRHRTTPVPPPKSFPRGIRQRARRTLSLSVQGRSNATPAPTTRDTPARTTPA
jgi:hypothetical protein